MTTTRKLILVLLAAVLVVGGCTENRDKQRKADEALSREALDRYQKAQPVPLYDYSQLRQNLIEIRTSQAEATQTTSFGFNQGVKDPVWQCPSIGFPIPSTYQLTNPEAKVRDKDLTLPQIENNGVYSGDSTGTFVICIDAKGKGYATYWEGFVQTVSGPAEWDSERGSVELTGASSFDYSEGKGK